MVSYCQVEGINTFFVVEVSARPSSPRTENGWKGMKRYLLMGNRCCCADAVSCAVTEDV